LWVRQAWARNKTICPKGRLGRCGGVAPTVEHLPSKCEALVHPSGRNSEREREEKQNKKPLGRDF
jgi:hypothetical protein